MINPVDEKSQNPDSSPAWYDMPYKSHNQVDAANLT